MMELSTGVNWDSSMTVLMICDINTYILIFAGGGGEEEMPTFTANIHNLIYNSYPQ